MLVPKNLFVETGHMIERDLSNIKRSPDFIVELTNVSSTGFHLDQRIFIIATIQNASYGISFCSYFNYAVYRLLYDLQCKG